MEFLEPKSRHKFPNETFGAFYPVKADERNFGVIATAYLSTQGLSIGVGEGVVV